MFKLILGDKVKKVVFLIAYFCLSLLCINYKETESVMTVSFEQTNLYNQNVYILTFKSFNSNNITQYFNKEEITILSIKPINYKSIEKEFIAKGVQEYLNLAYDGSLLVFLRSLEGDHGLSEEHKQELQQFVKEQQEKEEERQKQEESSEKTE